MVLVVVVFEINESTVEAEYTSIAGMFSNEVLEVNQRTRDFEPGMQ